MTLAPPTTSPREVPPSAAYDAAQKLSLSILNSEWTEHLLAIGSTLLFDRNPYALATEADDTDELPTTRVLWLVCSSPTQTQLIRASEALALLQLVRELDPARWIETLETIWPDESDEIDKSSWELLTKPITVGLAIEIATTEHFLWVSERLVGSETLSPRYRADFEAVQQELGRYPLEAPTPRIPVSLNIYELEDFAWGPRSRLYGQLLQLAMTQHRLIKLARQEHGDPSKPNQEIQDRACFHVVKLNLDGPALSNMNEQELDYVSRISVHGVRFARLISFNVESEVGLATTPALQALILPKGRRQYFGVEEVELSDSTPLNMIAPVLSALQVCQSVRKVYLTMDRHERISDKAQRRTLWQWIAYALFSRYARHKIQEVELDMRFLSSTDVADFQDAVLSKNPLKALRCSAPCENNLCICASRFFIDRGSELHAFHIDTPTIVRVVTSDKREQGDYWKVILPGYGIVLVLQDDATEISGYATQVDAYPVIKHLKIANGRAECVEVGYEFLRGLPCHVESIEFTDQYEYTLPGGSCYTPVLTSCPGLKRLVTPPGFTNDSVMKLADLAVAGKCELEVLHVGGMFYLRNYSDLIRFLDVLADVDHPLSRCLSELELNVSNEEDPDNSEDSDSSSDLENTDKALTVFVEAVHRMLTHNRRLHTVIFQSRGFNEEDPIGWPDENVVIRTAPLALRSKLALLSVSTCPQTTLSTAARSLDSVVLSIIFEFAAEHRMRRVIHRVEEYW